MIKILFLCTHNACRSILAEAIAQKLDNNRWQVASAGSHPAGKVHPLTLKYLREAGYDTESLYSKSQDELSLFMPDIVITVCDQAAGDSCPIWLESAVKVHWGLTDPSRQQDDDDTIQTAFHSTMNLLKNRLEKLLQNPIETMKKTEMETLLNSLEEQS